MMTIYGLFADMSMEDVERHFAGQGYGPFKKELAEVIVEGLRPIQERYRELVGSREVDEILARGAQRAAELAAPTLSDVKLKLGFLPT
ncbi:hypothetical protein GCM10025858_10920 [Alicyclobacillus sacchari]|nr:hypothetical protein GCM10025858_10920 [Alicyclobacillus sacchari]